MAHQVQQGIPLAMPFLEQEVVETLEFSVIGVSLSSSEAAACLSSKFWTRCRGEGLLIRPDGK